MRYPHFPSEQELTHCILSAGDLRQHSEGGKLWLLSRLSMEWACLQVGGALLPSLVEFYRWLHLNLGHLLTYDQASSITIGQVLALAERNLGKEMGAHIRSLYERVKVHYNRYVELIGGAIGAGACAAVRRGNRIFTIADDIPLLHFLSGNVTLKWCHVTWKCCHVTLKCCYVILNCRRYVNCCHVTLPLTLPLSP